MAGMRNVAPQVPEAVISDMLELADSRISWSYVMEIIYHLTSREAWAAAQPTGEYEALSLAEEGFIHCSADEAQMLRVAERLYPAATGLQVLDVDTTKLQAEVKREPSRSGELYPHIYGRINLDAVVHVRDLTLDADGRHSLS